MFQTCNKPLSPAKMVIWHTVSTSSLIWLRVKAHAEWYPLTIVLLVFYWSLHPPPVSCCGKAASVLRPYVQKAATKTSAGPWGQSMAMGTASGETRLKNEDIVNLSISINIYIYICYIYIYTRNPWALPRRCSVEVSHSQTNVDATSQNSYGKNNKGTREY